MTKKNIFPLGVLSVFLLMICSDRILSNSTNKKNKPPSFDVELNEGYIAFIANESEQKVPTPQPNPDPLKCPCKGTGDITHGDGHITPCPYHQKSNNEGEAAKEPIKCPCDTETTYCDCVDAYGECKCAERSAPQLYSDSSDDDLFPFLPDKQMVWFTASWCGPCQQFKYNEVPKLKYKGWRVSPDKNAHIKIVDVDEHRELYDKYGNGRGIPAFILFVDKQKVASIIGSTTAEEVSHMYNQKAPSTQYQFPAPVYRLQVQEDIP